MKEDSKLKNMQSIKNMKTNPFRELTEAEGEGEIGGFDFNLKEDIIVDFEESKRVIISREKKIEKVHDSL